MNELFEEMYLNKPSNGHPIEPCEATSNNIHCPSCMDDNGKFYLTRKGDNVDCKGFVVEDSF